MWLIPIALILIFAIGSVGIYGFIVGGWASDSKYALLGAMRTCAQLVSYEVSLALSVLGVAPASAAEPWLRAWTIERVICPTCDARTLAGINQAVGEKIATELFMTGGSLDAKRAAEIFPRLHRQLRGLRKRLADRRGAPERDAQQDGRAKCA